MGIIKLEIDKHFETDRHRIVKMTYGDKNNQVVDYMVEIKKKFLFIPYWRLLKNSEWTGDLRNDDPVTFTNKVEAVVCFENIMKYNLY